MFPDTTTAREDLEFLLLREKQGPQPFDYTPFHTFMSHEHREYLVCSINSVSFPVDVTGASSVAQNVPCSMSTI